MKARLEEINKLFTEAERIFNTFSSQEIEATYEFHNEGTSLNHCIHWGTIASKELLSDYKELKKEVKRMRKGRNTI